MVRRIYGSVNGSIPGAFDSHPGSDGVLDWTNYGSGLPTFTLPTSTNRYNAIVMDSSRTVPMGNYTKPRSFGSLACVFLGA